MFSDNENIIAFEGSCNFSRIALLENIENISVFCDWSGEGDQARINDIADSFNKTFSEHDESVTYLNVEDITIEITNIFSIKAIEGLLEDEKILVEDRNKETHSMSIKKILQKAKEKLNSIINNEGNITLDDNDSDGPMFPYSSGPRDYQQEAFEKWKVNKQCGLFSMATGTGKTITSLNCLLQIYKKTGYYKAIILVPTITLVNQWETECFKFNFKAITKVYSKNPNWRHEIDNIILQENLLDTNKISYIVIATYASYARKNTFEELNKLSSKTLLIADECHNLGSKTMLALLDKIICKRRIGLSATPERQFDEEGNQKLLSFFKCTDGYTYEILMKEAIKNNVLCNYYYYPHLVSLTDEEMDQYMELSRQISKYYKKTTDNFKNDPILTALLIARKRIIHKAFAKLDTLKEILQQHYNVKHNLKYTLIYVPEGNDTNDYYESDYYSESDDIDVDQETARLVDVYTNVVKNINNRITVKKFISGISDRNDILNKFAEGNIDVLTSMKCLDEGVDVPRAELAIFCASTGNKRQFVQRRGRILRKHPKKQFAYIHDLVVIPRVNENSGCYEMERSMLRKELERVKDFSESSENPTYTLDVLFDTMNYYNLNLYDNDKQ